MQLEFFLKKEQMQALSEYVKGKDVVVNLPTGYGKSLIYSLVCPRACDNLRRVKSKKERSMSLLISPLTALMDDQRLSLAQLGLSSLKLTPNVSEADISRIQSGDIQVIILSPESFECDVVKRTLQSAKECIHYCVAIDEAHFTAQLSVRGTDFRSAYDNSGEVRALLLPKLPLTALTATITETSLAYMVKKLSMDEFTLVKGSNNRMNIFYSFSKLEKYQYNDCEKMEMAFTNCFQLIIRDLKENGISAE